ncbi:hypothetical protein, unlikely [Trypanosoma brucei gambiense DAL972]|uniref:Uncharacterized protein n=1 Tax=Trypanosoma brucei gambiense (strain MHOM/CI/86/DAL972) TaxID=679716 RepID=D0A2D7_TRYB9|nr:hypothetical protein, unlikely [Trypanosoma brucei gambiense DAL972]CBH15431.1 hypothetical protein, unlikely [Trypanosoma brucei gambiense DAL972]|eukprot:XP_011777695.1 hypothetical protein, unlikely [Trypanosoma brucei gambiense DAL972]
MKTLLPVVNGTTVLFLFYQLKALRCANILAGFTFPPSPSQVVLAQHKDTLHLSYLHLPTSHLPNSSSILSTAHTVSDKLPPPFALTYARRMESYYDLLYSLILAQNFSAITKQREPQVKLLKISQMVFDQKNERAGTQWIFQAKKKRK